MIENVKAALVATKELHSKLGKLASPPSEEIKLLKALAATANRAIMEVHKQSLVASHEAAIRENLLRDVLQNELFDREAHAARISEAQREAMERLGPAGIPAYQRANAMVSKVEESIAALSPHKQFAGGTRILAENNWEEKSKEGTSNELPNS